MKKIIIFLVAFNTLLSFGQNPLLKADLQDTISAWSGPNFDLELTLKPDIKDDLLESLVFRKATTTTISPLGGNVTANFATYDEFYTNAGSSSISVTISGINRGERKAFYIENASTVTFFGATNVTPNDEALGSGRRIYNAWNIGGTVYVLALNETITDASTSNKGIQENATDTEAKALSATDKTITPGNISAITGGLIYKEVNIGVWNMNATSIVSIPHGVANHLNIRSVEVTIRDDADSYRYLLNSMLNNEGLVNGSVGTITSSNIWLYRTDASHFGTGTGFDNGTFDKTTGSYNRGWVRIGYKP